MSLGAEREIVAKSKRAKRRKTKSEETNLPNLSGVKFEDAVKALFQTVPPKKRT
jgi:hypothetical protein